MSRMIDRIDDLLLQQETKMSRKDIEDILLNALNIDKEHFIWEVFKYCPSSALKIVTDNKYKKIGEQIYTWIENRRDKHCMEESVVQFVWNFFEWDPEIALRYLDTFDERAKKSCSSTYKAQLEREIKRYKLLIN